MNVGEYFRDRSPVLLLNAAALLVLSVFLLLTGNTGTVVFLIAVVWISVAAVWLLAGYSFRSRYFRELMSVLDGLDRRYLISEVMRPAPGSEDRLYWEILRKSNRSVIEKIRELEDSQQEYKEYIESWIHEVKTPIAAIRLICENHREEYTGRIQSELDEIENEVEKVLYYVRMEQVYRDYLIHPVNLREIVLSAISGQKRHFIQCGMQIGLDMENFTVSTDEKWVEFILKQIFSNSMEYRRPEGARLRIYMASGRQQKSLILEDNGPGIPREDRRRIFEKCITGKNRRKYNGRATGMGLYLCRRLCEKLGIGISCESEEGAYTRMILTFPDSDHNRIGDDSADGRSENGTENSVKNSAKNSTKSTAEREEKAASRKKTPENAAERTEQSCENERLP